MKPETPEERRKGARITHVYRDLPNGDEEEIEVAVYGELYRAEPDVGIMAGGYELHGAVRVDNGEPIALTNSEETDLMIEAAEEEADRAEEAAIDRYEAQEGR